MRKNIVISIFILIFCDIQNGYAQNITRQGDTLIAKFAKAYQWYLNGKIIQGATNQKYIPIEKGNYSVQIGETSEPFLYKFERYINVSGLIYNKQLEPIGNAVINVNGVETITNTKGWYSVWCPKMTRTIVRAHHSDYISRSLGFITTNADSQFKDVLLDRFRASHTYDSRHSVMLGDEYFSLVIPESAVINEKTLKPYIGKVQVYLGIHRPGDVLFGEQMPGGDFLGVNQAGFEQVLYSYGFFTCELRDTSGNKLNLAQDKKSRVIFRVDPDQKINFDGNIPLWHFDEDKAMWVEHQVLNRIGNVYYSDIQHFSSWNMDSSSSTSSIEGNVIPCGGKTMGGGTIYAGQIPIQPDSKGFYNGWVPAGFAIDIFAGKKKKEFTTPKLEAGQVQQIPVITINNLKGSGEIDSMGLLKIYHFNNLGKMEYSINGGRTFVGTSEFKLTSDAKKTVECAIKDSMGCEFHFTAKTKIKYYQDCSVNKDTLFTNWNQFMLDESDIQLRKGVKIDNLYLNEYEFPERIDYAFQIGQCLSGITLNGIGNSESNSFANSIFLLFPQLQYFKIENGKKFQIQEQGWGKNLKYLSLSFCNLSSTLSVLGNWKQADYFFLKNNNLDILPPEVAEWKEVSRLHIINNNLVSLPIQVSEWKKLKTLSLRENKIESLPVQIGEWKELTTLNLDNNNLVSLPIQISEWKKLKTLSLRENKIESLPVQIGEWKELTTLDLDNNNLIVLPKEVGELKKMTELRIRNNKLATLPIEMLELKNNLKFLSLEGNVFSEDEQNKIRSWFPFTDVTF